MNVDDNALTSKVEYASHSGPSPSCCEVRRYAGGVALTNLTFSNATIKSYHCSFPQVVEECALRVKGGADVEGGSHGGLFKSSHRDKVEDRRRDEVQLGAGLNNSCKKEYN